MSTADGPEVSSRGTVSPLGSMTDLSALVWLIQSSDLATCSKNRLS